MANTTDTDETIDQAILNVLATTEGVPHANYSSVPPMAFDGFLPFSAPFMKFWDVDGFFADVTPRDVGPINVACMSDGGGVRGEDDDGHLSWTRVRTVHHSALRRGGVKFMSSQCVRLDIGMIMEDGDWGSSSYLGQLVRDEWFFHMVGVDPEQPFLDEDMSDSVNISHSMAFTFRYEWMVKMGFGGGPRVSLPTTPEGARALFKLRDVEAGRSRRSALKNWVKEHSRLSRSGKVSEIPAHLRGRQRFSWEGFECELIASPFDIELNSKSKKRKR